MNGDTIETLVARAINVRLAGWERAQAVRELAAHALDAERRTDLLNNALDRAERAERVLNELAAKLYRVEEELSRYIE